MVKTLQKSVKSLPSKAERDAARAFIRPDTWATQLDLEVDTKKFTTNGRGYIIPVLRDQSDEIVIKKAAQMCFTIAMLIKMLHCVVQRQWNGMYLLPFKQGARTFVQARVDPIITSNPLLSRHFTRVENVSHKQTDQKVNLYFRGTNIATELREAPVDFQIWDERDKFVTTWLGDAISRMDASEVAKLIQLSTPTAPGIGIDSDDAWRISDQCKWEVPCPHCNHFQVFTLEDNVKIGIDKYDSVFECSHCKKVINDFDRRACNDHGRWVPTYLDGRKRGYHISQFNSPTKKFEAIISGFFAGQDKVDALRDFYNLQLGLEYAGRGDKFTEKILDDCIVPGLHLRTVPDGPIFVGVDVGSVLHVKSSYLGRNGKRIAWDFKILRNFDQLEQFLSSLHNFMCVIDAHPEKHKAKELAKKFKGRIFLGFEKDSPNQATMFNFDEKKLEVSIDRTMALDQLVADYTDVKYSLPFDSRELGEEMPRKNYNGFYSHHLEMVRVPRELPGGVQTVRWEKTNNADHWHHADMFELVAFQKRPKLNISANVLNGLRNAGGLVQ